MNYELAKKLKDAGFPNITRWEVENNHRRTITVSGEESLPPLGALISEIPRIITQAEHCVKNGLNEDIRWNTESQFILTAETDKWLATHTKIEAYAEIPVHYGESTGSTPEEAVANLWLELNYHSNVAKLKTL